MPGLYKFFSADVSDKLMMDESHIGIKFSYLKDYNDPYEFFLTIDYDRTPNELAFYSEMIGMVLEQPTTCFTKSPTITPMWAHYAGNSSGFAIEIDEEKMMNHIEGIGYGEMTTISDVQYQDKPDDIDNLLGRAFVIGKPRYIYFLQDYIRRSAYLRKQTCWSYEQERRIVIDENALKKVNDWLMLLPVPIDCVTAFIVGKNADVHVRENIKKISNIANAKYLEMVFGKSSTNPFMLLDGVKTYVFERGEIIPSSYYCQSCREPINHNHNRCSWCSITEDHKRDAAYSNSFRLLENAGLLDSYLASIRRIGKD